MKVFLSLTLLVAVVFAEPPLYRQQQQNRYFFARQQEEPAQSGPYAPSGWRPDGPAFNLPQRSQKQQAPPQVENGYGPPQQPQQQYGPPQQPEPQYGAPQTQGQYRQPQFGRQQQQPQQQYGAPQQPEPQYGAPQQPEQQYNARVRQQQNGIAARQQQLPNQEYGAPNQPEPQQQYGAPQQPEPQYNAPARQQQFRASARQQQQPNQQYGAPNQPEPQQQYGAPNQPEPQQQYGAPQQQYGSPVPEFTTTDPTSATEIDEPTTVGGLTEAESEPIGSANELEEEADLNGQARPEQQQERGEYYVALPDGRLQRVRYVSRQDIEAMRYFAKIRAENVEPLRGPIYAYSPLQKLEVAPGQLQVAVAPEAVVSTAPSTLTVTATESKPQKLVQQPKVDIKPLAQVQIQHDNPAAVVPLSSSYTTYTANYQVPAAEERYILAFP